MHLSVEPLSSLMKTHSSLFIKLSSGRISTHAPFLIKHIEQIENVQRRATRQIPGFKDLSYPVRLKKLKLPTLSYRRLRGDLIETYKILHDVYDPQTVKFLNTRKESADRSSISGNTLTLFSQHSNLDLRLSSFSIRIVKSWNKLPESVVSAPSVNSFKILRKSWASIWPLQAWT